MNESDVINNILDVAHARATNKYNKRQEYDTEFFPGFEYDLLEVIENMLNTEKLNPIEDRALRDEWKIVNDHMFNFNKDLDNSVDIKYNINICD